MLKKDVVDYFGSQYAVARALNIKQPSVANWPDIVPPLRQLQIENLTKGKLKAEPGLKLGNRSQEAAA